MAVTDLDRSKGLLVSAALGLLVSAGLGLLVSAGLGLLVSAGLGLLECAVIARDELRGRISPGRGPARPLARG